MATKRHPKLKKLPIHKRDKIPIPNTLKINSGDLKTKFNTRLKSPTLPVKPSLIVIALAITANAIISETTYDKNKK